MESTMPILILALPLLTFLVLGLLGKYMKHEIGRAHV